MRESNWYVIHVCKKCEKRLSNNQRIYSRGVCPKCGNSSNSTICNTVDVIVKKVKNHPWWRFWNKEVYFIGRDEFSESWIKKIIK